MRCGVYKITKYLINVLFIWFLLLSFSAIIETSEMSDSFNIEKSNIKDENEIIPKAFIFKLTFTGLLATLWCNKNMIKLGIY